MSLPPKAILWFCAAANHCCALHLVKSILNSLRNQALCLQNNNQAVRQKRGTEKLRHYSIEMSRWAKPSSSSSALEAPLPMNFVVKFKLAQQAGGQMVLSQPQKIKLSIAQYLCSFQGGPKHLGLCAFKKWSPKESVKFIPRLSEEERKRKKKVIVDKVSEFFIIN